MQVMYDDYASHGFVTIGVNLTEDMESVVKVYARRFTFPMWRDPGTVWPVYTHHNSIPLNYIIDTSGVIRYWNEGFDENVLRSTIQQWLPDPIEHDVGVKLIIAPLNNVDSGATVTPACSVYNAGATAETYPVRMRIGTSYDTFAMVTNHQPGTDEYVTLPDWTAGARGLTIPVQCTTELASDDIGSNNNAVAYINIRVYDMAALEILAPTDTVDSGTAVIPSAVVRNTGSMGDVAKVKFFIGSSYVDSASLPLQPNRTDTASLPAWTPLQVGAVTVRCTVAARTRDLNPTNNLLTHTIYVRPAGIQEARAAMPGFTFYELNPNPCRGRATVRFSLPRAMNVNLSVYSASGRLVRILQAGNAQAGVHSLIWDGRDGAGLAVGRGVYYCRMRAGEFIAVRKLTVE